MNILTRISGIFKNFEDFWEENSQKIGPDHHQNS